MQRQLTSKPINHPFETCQKCRSRWSVTVNGVTVSVDISVCRRHLSMAMASKACIIGIQCKLEMHSEGCLPSAQSSSSDEGQRLLQPQRTIRRFLMPYRPEPNNYRARLKGSPQIWCILLLLLLTTSAWLLPEVFTQPGDHLLAESCK